MTPVFLDFETYWSKTHSLTKMSPIAYVLHPDTEIQSLAYKIGTDDTEVIFGERSIRKWAEEMDWSDKMAIAHNMSGFDSMLCVWRVGIEPKAWGCTMAMARPTFAKTVGCSLKAVAQALGLGKKLNLEATNTKGKRLKEFSAEEKEAMLVYNRQDTDLCAAIFNRLAPCTSNKEMKLIDMTVNMLVYPQFILDRPLLESTLKEERDRKSKMVLKVASYLPDDISGLPESAQLELVTKILASPAKFSGLLTDLGEVVPMKPSPSNPEKMIPALAKTDQEYLALQEHPNELIAAAARARLGVKSTILEKRVERFLEVADSTTGFMPIALMYYGADTTGRWSASGSFKLNQQNLPRVNPDEVKLSDALRKSLRAPEGYKVVVADLSGIELRVNHFLWKVTGSVKLFQENPHTADLYKAFAARLYAKPEKDVTKSERHIGKMAHLGLGFGAGAETFRRATKTMGDVDLTLEEAENVVRTWRGTYPEICRGWKTCHAALVHIHSAGLRARYSMTDHTVIDPWRLCVSTPTGIRTPVGEIHYPALRTELAQSKFGGTKQEWTYGDGRHKSRIYAGKIVENIVQHLARGILADMALAFSRTQLGKLYPLAHTVHDELVYVVRDEHAQKVLDGVQKIMKNGVIWWPELVTSSEGDIAQTYGDAK
jgi:hypothetical protein